MSLRTAGRRNSSWRETNKRPCIHARTPSPRRAGNPPAPHIVVIGVVLTVKANAAPRSTKVEP